MSEVLPVGRRPAEGLSVATPALSESLWLSDSCRLETGRRLRTAGRSRGGSMRVVTFLVMASSDWIAAGLSVSSSSAVDDG